MKIVRKQSDLTIRFKKYQTLQQIYANRNRSVRQNGVFNIKRPCYNFTKRYIYMYISLFSTCAEKLWSFETVTPPPNSAKLNFCKNYRNTTDLSLWKKRLSSTKKSYSSYIFSSHSFPLLCLIKINISFLHGFTVEFP